MRGQAAATGSEAKISASVVERVAAGTGLGDTVHLVLGHQGGASSTLTLSQTVPAAAGADQDSQAPSTASWLRARLRQGASAASSSVRTARSVFHDP